MIERHANAEENKRMRESERLAQKRKLGGFKPAGVLVELLSLDQHCL